MRMLFTLLSFVSAAALAKAGAPAFTFPRSTPEAQGVSSAALLQFVDEAERKIDALHSLMVVRHGHVIAEGWWAPYEAAEPHMMFSLSKSFTSTAVGLAVAEGRLTIDDPVLTFFPDLAPADPSANLHAMRVRDLLTMTAGHHEEDIRTFPYDGERDPAKAFLEPEALPEDPAAHRQLTQRLQKLTLPVVRGNRPASFDAKLVGRRYAFDLSVQKREESILVAPPEAIEWLALDRADANGAASLTVRMHGVDRTLTATPGTWTRGRLETPRGPQVMATSGGWTAPDTYTLKVVFLNTPFRNTYQLRFAGDQVFLRRERNVGPQDARILELTGRAVSPATASRGRIVRPAA